MSSSVDNIIGREEGFHGSVASDVHNDTDIIIISSSSASRLVQRTSLRAWKGGWLAQNTTCDKCSWSMQDAKSQAVLSGA